MAKTKNAKITLDYNNALAERVGRADGLSEAQIERVARRTPQVAERLAAERAAGTTPYRDLPYQDETVREVTSCVEARYGRQDAVVVLGIGGSALGTTAVQTACNAPWYNLTSAPKRRDPKLFVMDNVDPAHFAALLEMLDPKRTLFIVISKSGATAETMCQYLICRDLLKRKLGKHYGENIIAITDREKGYLRPIADDEGFETFCVPDGVGGRFSVLSPVGLLPLGMVGIDIKRLLAGAAAMDKRCKTDDLRKNPAFMSGAIQWLMYGKGKPMSVMMPYSQALIDVADWYRQLWAESLGKIRTAGRKKEFVGPTPVKALGVTDQHSQVQLYREGPNDKIFTLLAVKDFGCDVDIPAGYADVEGVGYLGGKTMGTLMNAEREATTFALTKSKRPNVTISLPVVDEFTVGQLLYMLEVQTSFVGELMGINTYNQPGVEEGKIATFALMGRKGYAKTRKAIRAQKPDRKFVI